MHEFSLINDLLKKIESVAREQKAARVTGVKVKLGALSHISAGHFREHFVHAVQNTVAEGAHLEVEQMENPDDPHAQDIWLDNVELE